MVSKSFTQGSQDPVPLGLTVDEVFVNTARTFENCLACVSAHQSVRCSYRELNQLVNRFAQGLKQLGVLAGDRVAVVSSNRLEWLVTQYATARVDAVLVTAHPASREEDLRFVISQANPKVLVAERSFAGFDRSDVLTSLATTAVWGTGRTKRRRILQVIVMDAPLAAPVLSWTALIEAQSAAISPPSHSGQSRRLNDPALILYTSGTTGRPKGVTHSHQAVVNGGNIVGQRLRFTCRDRLCLPVPVNHMFGCVTGHLAALTHGAAVVYPSGTFNASSCVESVEKERCTVLYGVPTMFQSILDTAPDERRMRSLRTGVIGGAKAPTKLIENVIRHVPDISVGYGMTEMSPILRTRCEHPREQWEKCAGMAEPHVDCKIVDLRTGDIVPRGIRGELCARGMTRMLGYWNDPDGTRQATDDDGWLHTGDLAVMRGDGYVTIVGRRKHMIVRGGENIDPREVEECLVEHPQIAAAEVVGVPDPVYGESTVAWIQTAAARRLPPDEVREHCRRRLAPHKIPSHVYPIVRFPTTTTGKVQKHVLRRMATRIQAAEKRSRTP